MDQKYRHELKYLVSQAQLSLLKVRIAPFMQQDPHAPGGSYNISSLYFDDYYNTSYYENENGTDPREKFRIRIYNHSPERISLECKRKERGKTLKTTCLLSREQADRLISGQAGGVIKTQPQEKSGVQPESGIRTHAPNGLEAKTQDAFVTQSVNTAEETSPLLRKIRTQMLTRLLHPVVVVEYERAPFIYPNGNVRITFDTNMSSSDMTAHFLEGEGARRPIMPAGWHLMEVKYDEFLPDFIYRALNLGTLRQTTYSKYYLCRRYALKGHRTNNTRSEP